MSSKTVLLIGGCADGQFVNIAHPVPSIEMPSVPLTPRMLALITRSRGDEPAKPDRYTRRETIVDRERVTAIYALESMSEADMFRALIAGYRRG